MSDPSVATAMSAATAAAEPPDDPPGTRLEIARIAHRDDKPEFSFDEPMANSSQFILPSTTAPAASSCATAVQSYGGTYLSRIFDPAVVRTPRVLITSLIPTGTPPSGGSGFPSAAMRSMRSACSQRALFRQRQKRADLPILFLDASIVRLGQGDRSGLALLHRGCVAASIVQ